VREERADRERPRHEIDISVANHNADFETKRENRAPGLEIPVVWEFATVETLGFARAVEEQVVGTDDNVVDDTTGSDDVYEPVNG
jgi:hypothetical protein